QQRGRTGASGDRARLRSGRAEGAPPRASLDAIRLRASVGAAGANGGVRDVVAFRAGGARMKGEPAVPARANQSPCGRCGLVGSLLPDYLGDRLDYLGGLLVIQLAGAE